MAGGFRLFPELERFDTKVGKQAFGRVQKILLRTWAFWLTAAGALVAVILLTGVLTYLFRRLGIAPTIMGGLIGGMLGGQIWAVLLLIYRRPLRLALRRELAAAGTPICIPCGYDLRGQTSPRCPECGTEYDAKLIRQGDRVEPKASDPLSE